jgi:hypothetical protein
MKEFVALGHSIGVDEVLFSTFVSWPNMKIQNYEEQAIHKASHSLHSKFVEIAEDVNLDPLVRLRVAFESIAKDSM